MNYSVHGYLIRAVLRYTAYNGRLPCHPISTIYIYVTFFVFIRFWSDLPQTDCMVKYGLAFQIHLNSTLILQPCNYHVSKFVVYEIEFEVKAVMQIKQFVV